MKFAFSSKGWHNVGFDEMCKIAKELKYDGIELHNTHGALFTDKDSAFYNYKSAAAVRRLYEIKLKYSTLARSYSLIIINITCTFTKYYSVKAKGLSTSH